LENLATVVDAKIAELRGAFGEIGDQRLIVMAAISLADERAEALARVAKLEEEIGRMREASRGVAMLAEDSARQIAQAIDEAAARIESASRVMDGGRS